MRVEQPWRVAGKRVAPRPAVLDTAWVPVVRSLRENEAAEGLLVVGGRSAGSRVACRTAVELGADAVLALSFPVRGRDKARVSRAPEVAAVLEAGLPLRIVQGARDPFGTPAQLRDELPTVDIVECAGAHSFSKDPADVYVAVREFLAGL